MANVPTDKFPRWDGTWPEEVLFSFLALTGEDSIRATEVTRTLRDLVNPVAGRRERIAELFARMRAHDCYKRLNALTAYKTVLAERKRLAKVNALFGDPFGEIRLAHTISMFVGGFNPDFVPKRATLADQRKVLLATRKLRRLLMPGAQPTDVFKMSELRRLLAELEDYLHLITRAAKDAGRRPARADEAAAQRYWLVGLCKELIGVFGEAPPAIVKEVAGMIGYTPDDSTIARYIERAHDERRRAPLAEEMLSGPGSRR